jgi:hypothetical protein
MTETFAARAARSKTLDLTLSMVSLGPEELASQNNNNTNNNYNNKQHPSTHK